MNSKMDDCTQVKNNLVKCFHNKPLLVIVHDMINLMSSFTIVKKSTTRNTSISVICCQITGACVDKETSL